MEQRIVISCWNCKRNYCILRDIAGPMQLTIKCPYCYKEGVVKLNDHLERGVEVIRSYSLSGDTIKRGNEYSSTFDSVWREIIED
jgi:hypothetical protein